MPICNDQLLTIGYGTLFYDSYFELLLSFVHHDSHRVINDLLSIYSEYPFFWFFKYLAIFIFPLLLEY